jgi:hypothetical protein
LDYLSGRRIGRNACWAGWQSHRVAPRYILLAAVCFKAVLFVLKMMVSKYLDRDEI